MKFGKSIGSQQENSELYYVDYKHLKKQIKDVVARNIEGDLAEALTGNSGFEESLIKEINSVNACFATRQRELLDRTAQLSESLQSLRRRCSEAELPPEEGEEDAEEFPASPLVRCSNAFRTLVRILGDVDSLRKYAVWNAVAVVKILKKRRKLTCFGLEDLASERAGWLARQTFFSGSDFAELHAAVESLGQMLIDCELDFSGHEPSCLSDAQPSQQCPICLDTLTDMVELDCSHRFCWKCFVLGPIAHQPGEYRITQCPICRRTAHPETDDDHNIRIPGAGGLLTRFLHTYFPQESGRRTGVSGDEEQEARKQGEDDEREMRDVVGELMRALLADSQGLRGLEGPRSASSGAAPRNFFETLPNRGQGQQQMQIGAAQKLQWLQLASTGDPFAIDSAAYCSLCAEPLLMETVVTTPCKHHFHKVCINRVEMPKCPICDTSLPFCWFLPPKHPCAMRGFNVVPPAEYRPQFPGGPSKGSGAWPLHSPPPTSLHAAGGVVMKSYLHRGAAAMAATAAALTDSEEPTAGDEDGAGAACSGERDGGSAHGSGDSGSSSSSSSEPSPPVPDAPPPDPRRYLYSALGRVRRVEGPSASLQASEEPEEAAVP